jgi:hypothetical protein
MGHFFVAIETKRNVINTPFTHIPYSHIGHKIHGTGNLAGLYIKWLGCLSLLAKSWLFCYEQKLTALNVLPSVVV